MHCLARDLRSFRTVYIECFRFTRLSQGTLPRRKNGSILCTTCTLPLKRSRVTAQGPRAGFCRHLLRTWAVLRRKCIIKKVEQTMQHVDDEKRVLSYLGIIKTLRPHRNDKSTCSPVIRTHPLERGSIDRFIPCHAIHKYAQRPMSSSSSSVSYAPPYRPRRRSTKLNPRN